MFKKNSWIVALLLVLTLTALFTGCIAAPPEVPPEEYEEVELGDFNVWGGQTYQRGWSVAGLKFLGVGDKPEVAKDKGYENDNFIKATKLKIEMEDASHPSGNLDIIWGAADENGDSVGFDWKQTGGIAFVKDGNVITIDLTAMVDYAKYKDAAIGAKRKIILQAGGEKANLPFVKKAWLLVPTKEEPFVSVTGITLKSQTGVVGKAFELEAVITPADATVQNISWSIYQPTEPDPNVNTANADFADADTSFIQPGSPKSKNKLMTTNPGGGVTKVKATISSAVVDNAGKYTSYTKDFVITFIDPTPLEYVVVSGTPKQTKEYEAIGDVAISTATTGSSSSWFQLTGVDNYGGPIYYIGADLGVGQVLGNFNNWEFDYSGTGDFDNKNFRISASTVKMTTNVYNDANYNGTGGIYVAANAGYNIAAGTGKKLELGVFQTGAGAASGDAEKNINSINTNYVYYKILPWNNNAASTYKFTNIKFTKVPLSYKVGTTPKTTSDTRSFSNNAGVSTIRVVTGGNGFKSTHFNKLDGVTIDDSGGYGQNQNWFKVDLGAALSTFVNKTDVAKTGTVTFKIKMNKEFTPGAGGIRVKMDANPQAPSNGGSLWAGLANVSATVNADTDVSITIKLGYDTRNNATPGATNLPGGAICDATTNNAIMSATQVWVWIYPQAINLSFTVSDIVFTAATP